MVLPELNKIKVFSAGPGTGEAAILTLVQFSCQAA